MDKFPLLQGEQVALLRVDKSTGIVLDENFSPDISEKQIRFSKFETQEEAVIYIESLKRVDIEFCIYDKNKNITIFNR